MTFKPLKLTGSLLKFPITTLYFLSSNDFVVSTLSSLNRGDTLNILLKQLDVKSNRDKNLLKGQLQSAKNSNDDDISENWFDQKLNHLDSEIKSTSKSSAGLTGATTSTTWKQRYFLNKKYYKPGGPLILMIGGEGEISSRYAGSAFFSEFMAKRWNGAVAALEHRFYGQSQPFADNYPLSTEHLSGYLHSRQALGDLAEFTKYMVSEDTKGAKVLCIGGSYPGNLAAWFREVYPDLTVGCFSHSAPVFAKMDYFEYGQVVYRAIGQSPSAKLLNGYRSIFSELSMGTLNMKKKILEKLRACPFSVLSKQDEADVESMITGALAGIVQYNNTLGDGQHIEDYVKIIEEAEDEESAAWQITERLVSSEALKSDSNCIDYSERTSYEEFRAAGESKNLTPFAAARSWVFQTCNEFGYFQTSRASVQNKTLYTDSVSDKSLWNDLCKNIFDISDTEARIADTRRFYDSQIGRNYIDKSSFKNIKNEKINNKFGHRATRTVFVNGANDPWSALGHTEFANSDDELYSFVVRNGSHCVGIYGDPYNSKVIPDAKILQWNLMNIGSQWLKTSDQNQKLDDVSTPSEIYQ